jgi:hypothetical protein
MKSGDHFIYEEVDFRSQAYQFSLLAVALIQIFRNVCQFATTFVQQSTYFMSF